ncbi:MAG: S49 family peptidase [Chlamydiales bacterium]
MAHKSIISSSFRAFFISLFAVLGILAGFVVVGLTASILFSTAKDENTFSTKVKILPDADGNRKDLGNSVPVLLQITLDGEIGKDPLTGKKIENMLLDSREDEFKNDRVKGILLIINSPGGGVNASDVIYRHLEDYKKRYQVPIYAFINGMAASGGYYVAAAADKIFASDVSLVGSIGVLAWPPFLNVYDAMEKLGINSMTLSAGKGKDEMNPFRPWKADEQKNYQELLDFFYGRFVEVVTLNRPQVNAKELIDNFGAALFPAKRALEYGLVDGSGYQRNEVIRELAKAVNIEKYQVVSFEAQQWWKKLFKEEARSPLITGKIKHEFSLPFSGEAFSFYSPS